MGVAKRLSTKRAASGGELDLSDITQVIDQILRKGARLGATTIHIEPRELAVLVRYRLDSGLREASPLPKAVLSELIDEIRQRAGITSSSRMPQAGQFSWREHEGIVLVQVDIAPMLDGEKAVLHIVREQQPVPDLLTLGFWGKNRETLLDALGEPRGLVIIASPHSAGKSTTLQSCIQLLIHPSIQVTVIEDHVAQKIAGVQQLTLNASHGLDVPLAIQIASRQDSNVIVIHELRSRQDIDAAIDAAHKRLVCASLNAPDAAAAKKYLASATTSHAIETNLRVITHQRLAHRLCEKCRVQVSMPAKLIAQLKLEGISVQQLCDMSQKYQLEYEAVGMAAPIAIRRELPLVWQSNEAGCDACRGTGYSGSIAICEVISHGHKLPSSLADAAIKSAAGLVDITTL